MAPRDDYDDDERERPSWREIDRRRDRSRHVSREQRGQRERALRSPWAKKQYLREADKLFKGKEGSKAHKDALDAIHRSYGTGKFAPSVKKYLKEFGLPTDWGTLVLLLDYKDDEVLAETIDALKSLVGERSSVERQALKNKLEILTFTAASGRVMSLAEAALREL